MSKKVKAIIAASAVLVVLAAALVVLLMTAPDPNDISSNPILTSEAIPLAKEDRYQIEYAEIENAKGKYKVVPIGENIFNIEGYDEYAVMRDMLPELLIEVCNVSANDVIAENVTDMKQFGLDPAVSTFTVKVKDKEPYSLSVGALSMDQTFYYVCKTGENTVYSVGATTFDHIFKGEREFLDLVVTEGFDSQNAATVPQINRVLISRPDLEKPMVFEKYKDGELSANAAQQASFRMTSPVEALISETPAQDYIYGNFGINADAVACVNPTAEDLTKFGFDEPTSVFEVDYNDNLKIRLKTGNGIPCQHDEDEDLTGHKHVNTHYYVLNKDGDRIYEVKTEAMRWMEMQHKDILSSFAIIPSIFDVEKLEFTVDEETHVLQYTSEKNENDANVIVGATLDGKEVDSYEARSMYQLLASTNITDINTGKTPPAKASITVKYHYFSGKTDTVELYELEDHTGIVSLNGNNAFVGRVGVQDKIRREMQNLKDGKKVDTDW